VKKIIIIFFSVFFVYACSNSTKKSEIRKDVEIAKTKFDTISLSETKAEETLYDKAKNDTTSISNLVDDKNTEKLKAVELQTINAKINNKEKESLDKIDIDSKNNAIENKKEEVIKADVNEVRIESSNNSTKNETSNVKSEKIVQLKKVIPVLDESKHSFVKKKNKINGDWAFKQEGNKTYIVFYANFKTKKGPDLKIFLTKKNMDQVTSKNALDASIFLENLKSNGGEQKYLIPSSIDISQYKSIIIHCKKYTILWGGSNF